MRIVVVEPAAERRADLVDLICELPGIEVRDAVASTAQCQRPLSSEPLDVIVAGALPTWELDALLAVSDRLGIEVVEVTSDARLVAELAELVALRAEPTAMRRLAMHTKSLKFERDTRAVSTRALSLHLQTGEPDRARHGSQTISLRSWLPQLVAELQAVVPDHVELVPIVAADTQSVRCVPAVLEDMLQALVLRACLQLPWGGTVWLMAGPGDDGEVRLEVLENGRGQVHDIVLHASARTSS